MFDDIDNDDIQAVVNQVRQNKAARDAIESRELDCYGMLGIRSSWRKSTRTKGRTNSSFWTSQQQSISEKHWLNW